MSTVFRVLSWVSLIIAIVIAAGYLLDSSYPSHFTQLMSKMKVEAVGFALLSVVLSNLDKSKKVETK